MSKWTTLSLAEVADIRSSNVDKKTLPGEVPVLLCNYMDVYSYEYIRNDHDYMQASATPDEIRRFKVQVGDVMMTKDSEVPSDIGISAVVTEPIESFVCGYHLALLKPNYDLVDPVFLAKQLSTNEVKKYFNQVANGSTRYGLTFRAIANTSIPLPPLPQQRRIAEVLSTVDDAIEATEALIAKQQQIKAGLMHDLFTRGVWTAASIARAQQAGSPAAASAKPGQLRPCRETAPELYQESPLGWIPKDWEVKTFNKSNVEVIDGDRGSNYPNGDDFSSDGYCVFLSANNVTKGGFRFDRVQCVSQAKHQLLRNGALEREDIVITTRGTVGNIAYFDQDVPFDVMRINSGMVILRSREQGLHSEFLYASLQNFLFDREFKRVVSGSAQPQLPVRDLEKFHYFIPPQDEQLALVEKVSALDLKSDSERQVSQKLQKQKQGLMQDLLTGRVSV